MRHDQITWNVIIYPFDGRQHVIEIDTPNGKQDIPHVLGILKERLKASEVKTVIGPYFVLTDLLIVGSEIAFIQDDADGYPIFMTSNCEGDRAIMETIAETLATALNSTD